MIHKSTSLTYEPSSEPHSFEAGGCAGPCSYLSAVELSKERMGTNKLVEALSGAIFSTNVCKSFFVVPGGVPECPGGGKQGSLSSPQMIIKTTETPVSPAPHSGLSRDFQPICDKFPLLDTQEPPSVPTLLPTVGAVD